MGILLGAIGDDITGSTDLALMLAKAGMPAVQYVGVPSESVPDADAPAAVVALKSRTAPVKMAVSQSVAACQWLLGQGALQIFFKYCSTFDSTAKGNIGPVAEALLDVLGAGMTVACPAFPANARTVYQGHLFVGDRLLSDSSMRDHPLTPMTDADLVRWLGRQVRTPESVGLLPYPDVGQGAAAIRQAMEELGRGGKRFVVVDALSDRHLIDIGTACRDLKLVTGGSGVAMGLPANFRNAGLLAEYAGLAPLPELAGHVAVIAGSCSAATRAQIDSMARVFPAFKLDPLKLSQDPAAVEAVLARAQKAAQRGPFLIFTSDSPQAVATIQARLGRAKAGALIEAALADIAGRLHQQGICKFIVAGGETSGAVLEKLGVTALRIGPEISPGVPWTVSQSPSGLCLALKSGNFGSADFFEKAIGMLP
jgi:uncharacterized protein YgbK (DUF1537 family)